MTERRFSLEKAEFVSKGPAQFLIHDKLEDKIYYSWIVADMNRLVKLMNKLTRVSR